MVFTVGLSAATEADVRFDFQTRGAPVTGTGGRPPSPRAADFESQDGTLVIPAGETTATIAVSVFGDRTDEPDEVIVANVVNAVPALEPLAGRGTIRDDDGPPSVTIAKAPADYASAGGIRVFPPGLTERTFTVLLNGDVGDERDAESFGATLGTVENATVPRPSG
jgi:hypothetical protein